MRRACAARTTCDAAARQPPELASWDRDRRQNKPGNAASWIHRPSSVYPIFENALRARRMGTSRMGADGSLHARGGRESARLVPDGAARARPTRMRVPLHQVPELGRRRPRLDHLGRQRAPLRALGRWIHYWGGQARSAPGIPERPDFARCPAGAAAAHALEAVHHSIDHIDLQLLPGRGRDGVRDARRRRGGSARPHGDRRAAVRGRPGQQLHAALARLDGGAPARAARQRRARDRQRLVPHQALGLVCSAAPPEKQGEAPPADLGPRRRCPSRTPKDARSSRPTPCCTTARARPSAASRSAASRAASASSPTRRPTRELEAFAPRAGGRRGRVRQRDGRNLFEPE